MAVSITIPAWKDAPELLSDILIHAESSSKTQQRVTISDNNGLKLTWTGVHTAMMGSHVVKRQPNDVVFEIKVENSTDGKTWKPSKVKPSHDMAVGPNTLSIIEALDGENNNELDSSIVYFRYLHKNKK